MDEVIKEDLPKGDIVLVENKTNLGFAGAIDVGIKHTNNRYVILLNSDVLLHDTSYLSALSKIRDDETLFAISFAQREQNNMTVGKNTIYWRDGFFHHKKAGDLNAGINGWAEGGACIIDKKKYEEIGGFDKLFSPFYWEDVDLSYRAWKKGFKILFDPNIIVDHHHESTIKKFFSVSTIKKIAYRNQFIFIWKNIDDTMLLLSHLAYIASKLPIMIFRDHAFIWGLLSAIWRIPAIVKRKTKYQLSDKQILTKFI